jgi:hypothetical protein
MTELIGGWRSPLLFLCCLHPTSKWLSTGDVVLEKQLQAAGGLIEGMLISEEAAVFGAAY